MTSWRHSSLDMVITPPLFCSTTLTLAVDASKCRNLVDFETFQPKSFKIKILKVWGEAKNNEIISNSVAILLSCTRWFYHARMKPFHSTFLLLVQTFVHTGTVSGCKKSCVLFSSVAVFISSTSTSPMKYETWKYDKRKPLVTTSCHRRWRKKIGYFEYSINIFWHAPSEPRHSFEHYLIFPFVYNSEKQTIAGGSVMCQYVLKCMLDGTARGVNAL